MIRVIYSYRVVILESEMNSFSRDTGIGCAVGSGLSLNHESNDILLYLKNDSQLSILYIP